MRGDLPQFFLNFRCCIFCQFVLEVPVTMTYPAVFHMIDSLVIRLQDFKTSWRPHNKNNSNNNDLSRDS